ncbi:ABC transporter ATP-binding protein [Geobacter sp. AOG1]|uniref:ABC transporter ATP-binding protein n=1 Tax=Geobacter sp. AOG1 TaxID=1566346 RepID=UPI001CC509E8|nr:ABC transporter ATP-binding protein [Geobacter sp. AOG1]GFE58466.1 ABC transporter ATP-binding protein [Geobacter sp. AOG1]
MFAIDIQGLSKSYKTKRHLTVNALKELTLSVEQGEVFGFLGPNGAGKSTTIKCLLGLIRPTSGTATIMGDSVTGDNYRRKVGYLPENPAFYDYLGAEEYLLFVGRIFKMQEELLARRTVDCLKLLELWDARKRPLRSYSKGMVQRLGLAQVLLHDPDVYILDEPMSGLDPIGRALVKDIILDLKRRGKCVFFSTHITDDVEKVCDRVAIINRGMLQVVDKVDNILQQGIEGYDVRTTAANGQVEELFIEKNALQSFIQQSINNQTSIERIEPRRKNIEAFFLDVVAQQ